MSNSTDAMRSNPNVAEMEQARLLNYDHRLVDWAMDEVVTEDASVVPDVMDFLADLAARRKAVRRLLQDEA